MDNFNMIAGYAKEKKELKKICDVLNNRESLRRKPVRRSI